MIEKQKLKIEFNCQKCKHPVVFSIFELEEGEGLIPCGQCGKNYLFQDEQLKRQLKKFIALCRQLQESEEILSQTAVGVDIGEKHVKIPYKLLLTRFNSTLDLRIGNEAVSFTFRVEPLSLE